LQRAHLGLMKSFTTTVAVAAVTTRDFPRRSEALFSN
jgi:hypothetical protein